MFNITVRTATEAMFAKILPTIRRRYYKMENPRETRFCRFELTGDGKVAYYQSFEE